VMYIYIIMIDQGVGDDMHRTQLFIPKDLHNFLHEKSIEEGITVSECVRRILTDYFHRNHRTTTEKGIQALLQMTE